MPSVWYGKSLQSGQNSQLRGPDFENLSPPNHPEHRFQSSVRGSSQDGVTPRRQLGCHSAEDHDSHQRNADEQSQNQAQENNESYATMDLDENTDSHQALGLPRNPESLSRGSISQNPQLNRNRSHDSMARKHKRRSKRLRKLKPDKGTPELDLEAALETPQPAAQVSSPPTKPKPKPKPKRVSNMVRELQGFNKSPEPDKDPEQEDERPEAVRSSRTAAARPQHKPAMLREIEPYNLSPEHDSETDVKVPGDWEDTRLSRGRRRNLVEISKGKNPTPRKNLNLSGLMRAELSGTNKNAKTFCTKDDDVRGPSSNQKQTKSRKEDEEVEEDEVEGDKNEEIEIEDEEDDDEDREEDDDEGEHDEDEEEDKDESDDGYVE